ncbi:UDP-GlcNAc:betaGal beta-1,3-N-acetylglucosaminyltransferase 7-like [Scleropages formosus]|uniref:Hexosyltransferase n=1 Tax=Scleropages formosus TaxID=113540 RepID=A0A0P7Z948_SCLFO|nr:UDP-GlcNAc:betaGal beta-1,3-N-acetylglucosaminyltransferase 7-like [Scleropages formosus]
MVTVMMKSNITIDQLWVKTVDLQKLIPHEFTSQHDLFLREDLETTPEAPYMTQMVVEWDVTTSDCMANYSVAQTMWFNSLEPKFQNYVLYRHCRYFPIVMNHPEKCSEDTYLLVVIKSVVTHHDRRELIRKTWGKKQEINGKKIRTLFLLGEAPDDGESAHHQKLLEYENEIFGDILQWNFLDSFYNLTLKETHFLKWFSIYCHKVRYIFKGDDDIFVNIPNIIEYLKETQVKNLFVGDVIFSAKPIRNRESKYYIPKELYSKPRYPPYAGGGGFVMDGVLARKLYMASQSIELYPIDDVFLGMCLRSLQVKPIKHNAFKTFGLVKDKSSILNKEPCFFKSLIVVHKLLPPELIKMWELVNRDLICTHKYDYVHL